MAEGVGGLAESRLWSEGERCARRRDQVCRARSASGAMVKRHRHGIAGGIRSLRREQGVQAMNQQRPVTRRYRAPVQRTFVKRCPWPPADPTLESAAAAE